MDKLQFMRMFLAMGEMTEQTREEKVAYKERIVFATEGIIKPYNWGELPLEEKERRLELLTKEL
jgi:hypothetical protein|tara:strand:- start:219 stop:410 length:192 start_codon:yes stop_codon:yes gene_type:complete